MPSSSKRQREIARRRAERQVERRRQKEKQRRRRTLLTTGGVFAVVLLVILGLTVFRDVFTGDDEEPGANATPSASASPTAEPAVACGAKKPKAVESKKFPKEPPITIDTKKQHTMSIKTSCGVVDATLFADKAPHTVNSLSYLATQNYYDGTFCHRMTSGEALTVLQCGDQSGTGGGDLGYTLAEENLAGAKYTRGTVAMAKTQAPHSTGSQFFLVVKDSDLPPDYTVVGRISDAGLKVLDKILALGIDDTDGQTEFGLDGAPKQRVYIEDLTLTAK